MGTVSALLPQSKYIMKFLLVVVLLAYTRAEAEPEADADPLLLYGTYGALAHLPTVSVKTTPAEVKTVVNPVTYTLPAYTYGLGYPYTYGHLGYPYLGLVPTVAAEAAAEEPAVDAVDRKKREAEAEADPEADPWLLYSGLTHYTAPYVYHAAALPKVEVKAVEPVKSTLTSSLGYPYTYGYGGPYLGLVPTVAAKAAEEPAVEAADRKKRDADADPAVLAAYTKVLSAPTPIIHAPTAYHAPLTYSTLGLGYTYGYPYVYGK